MRRPMVREPGWRCRFGLCPRGYLECLFQQQEPAAAEGFDQPGLGEAVERVHGVALVDGGLCGNLRQLDGIQNHRRDHPSTGFVGQQPGELP